MLSQKDFQADQIGSTVDWPDFDSDQADIDGDQADPGPDYADQHANRADQPWVTWLWPIIWKECCLRCTLTADRDNPSWSKQGYFINVNLCVPTCTYVYITCTKYDTVPNHAHPHANCANKETEPPVQWWYPKKDFQANQTDCTADRPDFDGDPADFDGSNLSHDLTMLTNMLTDLLTQLTHLGRSKVILYTCTYVYLRVPTCTYVYLNEHNFVNINVWLVLYSITCRICFMDIGLSFIQN